MFGFVKVEKLAQDCVRAFSGIFLELGALMHTKETLRLPGKDNGFIN